MEVRREKTAFNGSALRDDAANKAAYMILLELVSQAKLSRLGFQLLQVFDKSIGRCCSLMRVLDLINANF